MSVYRCRALKLEDTATGAPLDMTPTELNPHVDGLDSGAYFVQTATSADNSCYTDRDPADAGMRFTDPVSGTRRQPDLVSRVLGAVQCHQSLIDIVHFLEDGPGDGWASGAYRTRVGTQPNPGGWVWWTSTAQSKRIVDVTYSYAAGSVTPATKQWRLYATDGVTVVRTLTDSYTWNGPILTATSRSWS